MEGKMSLLEKIASAFHDNWRKTKLKEDGTYEPRWRKVEDVEFIKALDLGNLPDTIRITAENDVEIDIANTCYSQLSEDWKRENKQAAEVVIEILTSGKTYTREEIGDIIHTAWLKRNPRASSDPVLGLPFAELPENEQAKDLEQYDVALQVMRSTEIKR